MVRATRAGEGLAILAVTRCMAIIGHLPTDSSLSRRGKTALEECEPRSSVCLRNLAIPPEVSTRRGSLDA